MRHPVALPAFILCLVLLFTPGLCQKRSITFPLHGVTIDDVTPIDDLVEALKFPKVFPASRIVFDEGQAPSYYSDALKAIYPVSYVMGELLDSYFWRRFNLDNYTSRILSYYAAFPNTVDIWEIGNEVNGEWLGSSSDVIDKIAVGYDEAKSRGYTTALTIYYNGDNDTGINSCWRSKANQWENWLLNLPLRVRTGIDFALVSFYDDDCPLSTPPNWTDVFTRLSVIFPNAKVGFGEVGSKSAAPNIVSQRMLRYYNMSCARADDLVTPNFIGGYFWWYFIRDCVPKGKIDSVWNALASMFMCQPFTPFPEKHETDKKWVLWVCVGAGVCVAVCVCVACVYVRSKTVREWERAPSVESVEQTSVRRSAESEMKREGGGEGEGDGTSALA